MIADDQHFGALVLALLLDAAGDDLRDGDVLVVAQKVFSKAQDRYVALSTVTPSPEAIRLGEETEKDPRAVELILSESSEILRKRVGVIIVVHRLGMVMANAGLSPALSCRHQSDSIRLLFPSSSFS